MLVTDPRSLIISGSSESGHAESQYSMALAGYRLRIIGNTITLTAPAAKVSLAKKVNATKTSTNNDDTIDSIFANLAGSFVDGARGADTLNVTEVGDSQATANLDGITNVETINLSLSSATSIIGVDSLIPAGGNLVINHAAGDTPLHFDGSAETDGAFTFNTSIDDQPDVLMGGAGDDTFNYADSTDSTGGLSLMGMDGDDVFHVGELHAVTIAGGAGYDVLNHYKNGWTMTPLNITGIERINVIGNSIFELNLNDAMLPADAPLIIDASHADKWGVTVQFDDVTSGRVDFIGSTAGDHLYLNGSNDPNTIDHFSLGSGSDLVQLASLHRSNTIANSAGIDEVSNFNIAGQDQIILSTWRNMLYEITVTTANHADFVSQINSALGDSGITTETAASGDIYRVQIAAGEMAGTYVISDKTGDLVTTDDEVLKLTGDIGEIGVDQFGWYPDWP
ncbi:MAG: hypothetical protein EOM20_17245 [Spartobacteria bacterium]|nr:hypothetical protein [Spartobacteria bacterium]